MMMMSTGENVKFRSVPNQEIARPLSTYDNLNNESKLNGSNACENDANERREHVNEFPFSGISFRFDELKQLNQNTTPTVHSSNGYDNINNNNYKNHRNNNNTNQNVNNSSSQFNGNGMNQIRSNQGHHHHTVTTIAQNHSSSSSTTSSSSSSSSSENSYKHSSSSPLQYTNLAGNPIANRGINKPVHSVAKSQFLGLHKPSDNELNTTIESRINGGPMKQNLENKSQDERDNTGESSTMSEEEPLLNGYGSRMTTVGLNRAPSNSTQYQNVPSNSSCYGQNQIDNANECTCMCKGDSDPGTEIRQYESDRYKCNGCLNRNSGGSAPINVIPISSMNVPTCSKTVDLSSCATSMKPAKPTTLDTSSSFRMNQSPLSQAVYMSTTVPQNIKGCNIMGSHLPTRNSLRHSRMLVGKKTYQVVRRRNPLSIRHPNSVKYLFNLHILIGLGVSCLGLWLCWWAPSTSARDNPYWSGLILMLSGILGIIVLAFKPRPRQKLRQHFITFLRINSTFVTFIAAICTFVASSFAIFHLTNILSPVADCRPVHILVDSSACTCRFDGISANDTATGTPKSDAEILNGSYYRDLSCNEVMGPFKYILIASAILNFIGFLLCFTLLILLCMRQKPVKRVPYSSASSRHRL